MLVTKLLTTESQLPAHNAGLREVPGAATDSIPLSANAYFHSPIAPIAVGLPVRQYHGSLGAWLSSNWQQPTTNLMFSSESPRYNCTLLLSPKHAHCRSSKLATAIILHYTPVPQRYNAVSRFSLLITHAHTTPAHAPRQYAL